VTTVRAAGDAALLLDTGPPMATDQDGNGAAAVAAVIRSADLPGVTDVVPGAVTVLVSFEPGSWAMADLAHRLSALAATAAAAPREVAPAPATIDVCYDGPDLADVAALTGLTVPEVIARHQAGQYRVGWLGFAPGFGYLTGLDPVLATVPRLDSPRQRVPAGSVAIAGGFAAVYPAASPGGWRLLGRSAAPLWDPDRDPPSLLTPGMRVQFRAVDGLAPALGQDKPPSTGAPTAGQAAAERRVQVLQPGPLTTVQDLGRAGLAHLGVPGSGAADAASLRLANNLVGNDASAAGLEVTLGRLSLRFDAAAMVAVTGAAAPVRVSAAGGAAALGAAPASDRERSAAVAAHDGEPAGERDRPAAHPPDMGMADGPGGKAADRAANVGTAFPVATGSVLRLGAPPAGLRTYVAIDGGIAVDPVLGSRSADTLSGLGPAPLRPYDWLPLGRPRSLRSDRQPTQAHAAGLAATAGDVVALRAIAGPRHDWFAAAALDALATSTYVVSPASNRTGLRLTGPGLRRARPGELLSEGLAAGSLQVTHDGQPILLLADRPTTGGYPVIAVVVSADLRLGAQLRPGQRVRFRVSPAQAWPASAASAG
jgi:KipI family sensor histidine kinase inhibitor